MIVYSTEVAYETKQIAKKSLFNFWGDNCVNTIYPVFMRKNLFLFKL